MYRQYLVITRLMHEAGVKLLAGTDAGANPLCFPGTGVHAELLALVEAGLSPAEAIQTATINPAIFFGIEKDFGSVATGKIADLVVLNNNPFSDIENISSIEAVIQHGRLITRDSIDQVAKKILVENN